MQFLGKHFWRKEKEKNNFWIHNKLLSIWRARRYNCFYTYIQVHVRDARALGERKSRAGKRNRNQIWPWAGARGGSSSSTNIRSFSSKTFGIVLASVRARSPAGDDIQCSCTLYHNFIYIESKLKSICIKKKNADNLTMIFSEWQVHHTHTRTREKSSLTNWRPLKLI